MVWKPICQSLPLSTASPHLTLPPLPPLLMHFWSVGTFSLRAMASKRARSFELFTSCEPCAMCLGATLWSGVDKIVCGACKEDAAAIGFDEGPVFPESYAQLEASGCKVLRQVRRKEAQQVLFDYGKTGIIYNGRAENSDLVSMARDPA